MFSYRFSPGHKTYYILMRDTPRPILRKLLRRGYGHAVIAVNDGFNWYVINPATERVDIEILPFTADTSIRKIFKADEWRRIKVVMDAPPVATFFSFGFFTCIALVKRFIGLRGCWTFTPYGLFKWLASCPRSKFRRHNLIDVEII